MNRREFIKNTISVSGPILVCAGWIKTKTRPAEAGQLQRPPDERLEKEFLSRCV